jgi:hypothetical protein
MADAQTPATAGLAGSMHEFLLSTSLLFAGSTKSSKWRRKSTPTIGKLTAARRKVQVNFRPPN